MTRRTTFLTTVLIVSAHTLIALVAVTQSQPDVAVAALAGIPLSAAWQLARRP